ncbi:hypothetical protein J6590_002609 [Homalodisca vitripennis]|nr:hypothetical protein J6590_002609 [Homalodisca vitripennis]
MQRGGGRCGRRGTQVKPAAQTRMSGSNRVIGPLPSGSTTRKSFSARMRLSTVFELLIIALLIAFAASRVIGSYSTFPPISRSPLADTRAPVAADSHA